LTLEERWRAMPPVPSRLPTEPHSTRVFPVRSPDLVTSRIRLVATMIRREHIYERHHRRRFFERPTYMRGRIKEEGRRSLFAHLVRKKVQAVKRDKSLGY
jgi:hypothetical protein